MDSHPNTSNGTQGIATREDLLQEVNKLQKVNQELYQFTVDQLMSEVQQNIETSRT
jgi:hypothetical protein